MSFTLTALSQPVASNEGLKHAVLQSLLNHAQAKSNDTIDDGHHRQGWWGKDFNRAIGSRSWLLARSKNTDETRKKLKRYTEQALLWLVDEKLVESIDVSIENHGDRVDVVVEATGQASATYSAFLTFNFMRQS